MKVRILKILSPSRIIVRPSDWEEDYLKLKEKLNCYHNRACNGFLTVENLSSSQLIGNVFSVKVKNHWYRAIVIENVIIDDDKVVVRLVDTGDVVVVSSEDIRECPEMFLLSPGLAFYCHLEGVYTVDGVITEEELDQIRSSVPAGPVDLARRGPVVRKKYSDEDVDHEMFSLPVEISWSKDESSDPFQPNEVSHFSLTEICLSHMKIGTDINDNLMELNDLKNYLPDNNEFDHVQPMPKSESFKWLPPELPDKATFSARGTNVDQSGQIYIQPSPRRQTVRALKRLLNEKFLDSPPDEHQTLLEEGQSCCVRWTDGSWYRARFLEYINDKRDRAHVFLVDFGNLYIANVITEIRRDIFAERVPIQAITVELADVAPAGSNGTWHHDALNMMQECINYQRFQDKSNKLHIRVIGRTNRMPLSVSISLKSADKTRIDLANLLSMHGHCNWVENYHHYSEDFLALRNPVDFGIKAVPSETYPEKNFFMLLIDEDINSCNIKKEVYETTFIDWTKAVVMRGDLLPVEVVEISDYKTVFLHPTLSSGDYLVKLLTDYDYALEESQDEVVMNPPVFQPNVGLIVMAQYLGDWYRAKIISFDDKEIFVDFIDYGNKATIRDSLMIKEIPDKLARLPVMSIKLTLDIETIETEIEQEIVHSLMMEYIRSNTDCDVGVMISSLGNNGNLTGHLVNINTGGLIYEGLVKESIIDTVC